MLGLLLLYVFPPPGPALCKLGQPRVLFVLPEVLTPVLGPSFDLPLFYFHGLFPSLSFQFSSVAQSCLTLCGPMDFSPGRILESIVFPFSRGSSQPRDQTRSPALAGAFFITVPPGKHHYIPSVQFSSVAQSCLTLCNPMNRSMAGLPVHHQLPEFTQTHVHRVSDAIQPSHPRSSPSPPAPKSLPASESFPMSQLFP